MNRHILAILMSLTLCAAASAQQAPAGLDSRPAELEAQSARQASSAPAGAAALAASLPAGLLPDLASGAAPSLVNWAVMVSVLAVAPAVLVLVTSFTRIIVVLSLLRTALGMQQAPPNQVLFGLALLMTIVVMAPTARSVQQEAIEPYLAGRMTAPAALSAGESRARQFMIRQLVAAGNGDEVRLFMPPERAATVNDWREVDTWSLIPGYVVSELKVAFVMGFRIFLPLLIVDLLVASVLVSMGMLMTPPSLVALPFKLLLFVLADGWHLVIGGLMTSFQ